jgi:hypothetical protein
MKRYLVVANQTLGGEHLVDRLRQAVAEGPCAIHVLVPASNNPSAWTFDTDSDVSAARERLERARTRFADLGCEVTGEVGDARPVDAVLDVLNRETFDEVIISTLPPGVSRWLGMDLISRVRRAVTVPVSHVPAAAEPATKP